MLKSFLILDLPLDAMDEEIRKRYLDLVKKFTPEQYPEKFRRITSAYEKIKDRRSRVESKIFSAIRDVNYEETLRELAGLVKFSKRRTGLKKLASSYLSENNKTK